MGEDVPATRRRLSPVLIPEEALSDENKNSACWQSADATLTWSTMSTELADFIANRVVRSLTLRSDEGGKYVNLVRAQVYHATHAEILDDLYIILKSK